jgi:hypothetical protein
MIKEFPAVDSHGRSRTPFAVICVDDDPDPQLSHGLVYLTMKEYMDQLRSPDSLWKCPICHNSAKWSDENMANFEG